MESIYYCNGCSQYLHATSFSISTSKKHLGRCKSCIQKENISNQRKVNETYTDLLEGLLNYESESNNSGLQHEKVITLRFVDLLREQDLCHLVENIWGRRSCISGETDINKLTLIRWQRNSEFTPWNCMLVTWEEKQYHESAIEPTSFYFESFVRSIHQKHKFARAYFSRLEAYSLVMNN